MKITIAKSLLTHQEEIRLARRVQDMLNNKDNKRLVRIGTKARDTLVTHNLGLVAKLANKFPLRATNCSYEDLFQEGVAGLIHGIEKFDTTRGYRLSTYVYNWIRAYIQRYYSNHATNIRIPVHVSDRRQQLNRMANKMSVELGREVTMDDLPDDYGETMDKITHEVSLNQLVGDGGTSIEDFVSDDNNADVYYEYEVIKEYIFPVLSDRERDVLIHRFGLEGETPKTLTEIGEVFDVTRARIHQIERNALNKLRENCHLAKCSV